MPTTGRKPRKPKHITAQSITLEDAKGNPRIFMDAGNGDGSASICVFGNNDRSIQLTADRDGGVYIAVYGQRGTVSASLAMPANEHAGLSILDRQGRRGTLLGSVSETGEHRLRLFRDGLECWSAPTPAKPKHKK